MFYISENEKFSANINADKLAETICNNFLVSHPEFENLYNPKEERIQVEKISKSLKGNFAEIEQFLECYWNQKLIQEWTEANDKIHSLKIQEKLNFSPLKEACNSAPLSQTQSKSANSNLSITILSKNVLQKDDSKKAVEMAGYTIASGSSGAGFAVLIEASIDLAIEKAIFITEIVPMVITSAVFGLAACVIKKAFEEN